jgi:hypothetical protein
VQWCWWACCGGCIAVEQGRAISCKSPHNLTDKNKPRD